MAKPDQDQFSQKEAKSRFEAALRGARIVGHKTMDDLKADKPKKSKVKSAAKRKPVKK
jgi:hypothetical protein